MVNDLKDKQAKALALSDDMKRLPRNLNRLGFRSYRFQWCIFLELFVEICTLTGSWILRRPSVRRSNTLSVNSSYIVVGKQIKEIERVTNDIRNIQKTVNIASSSLQRADAVAEDIIYTVID